jgi:hypothetical protein
MIIEVLAGIAVVLVAGHVLITFVGKNDKYHKQNHKWKVHNAEVVNPVVVSERTVVHETNEQEFLNYGKVIANEQKIKVLNQRLGNLEHTTATIAKTQVESFPIEEGKVDLEKFDFRIKVLEQQIDDIQNPKPKPDTFYGQKNDPMEATIQSLVFNSKKK